MLTDKELQGLLNNVNQHLRPQWERLEALELQIKELCDTKAKVVKSKSKRV